MITTSDIAFLRTANKRRNIKLKETDIAKWIEGRRALPTDTPFPGFWRNDRTPYLTEIMNCMSPDSLIQHIACMKGAQLGLTATAENVIAYWIDENPAAILYISATNELLAKWAENRLEPLIDSCGIRGKIEKSLGNSKSRRTGDKTLSKKFDGGSLNMASAQSAGSLRSSSKRVLIRDEIDGAPSHLKTGEGNWLKVSYARAAAFGERKKVMDFSTPTTFEDSQILRSYEAGDQRKFEVPCPYCGEFQFLEWGNDKTEYGIKAIREKGKLKGVYYQCRHCKEPIKNHHKTKMLRAGRWKPTAVSKSGAYRSYHISTLYSPAGMMSWRELQEIMDEATLSGDPDDMRAFINLYLGLPYREVGERPKLDKVTRLRGDYRAGTVPFGVLFLTAGIDVQRGSETDETNPPRLEMEVCGHGAGFRTFSIMYRRFEGPVKDPSEGAWLELEEFARDSKMTFLRSDGMGFTPALMLIDSGDGALTDTVYNFCQGWGGTYPSKGFGVLGTRKDEKQDPQGPSNFRRYRAAKIGADILYEMSTNYYKKHIYRNLHKERKDVGPQGPGYCDFPLDYDEQYFRMLTAEEQRRDGSFYSGGRRNEALDCRVMCVCAADVYLDSEVMRAKAAAMKDGATRDQVQVITHRLILDYMANRVAPLRVDGREKPE